MANDLQRRVETLLRRQDDILYCEGGCYAFVRFRRCEGSVRAYFNDGEWRVKPIAGLEELASETITRARMFVRWHTMTNCWDTALFLTGLIESEGTTLKSTDVDALIKKQMEAGIVRRSTAADSADFIAYRQGENPLVRHMSVIVQQSNEVSRYLARLRDAKDSVKALLNVSVESVESESCGDGRVLLERPSGGTDMWGGANPALDERCVVVETSLTPTFYEFK